VPDRDRRFVPDLTDVVGWLYETDAGLRDRIFHGSAKSVLLKMCFVRGGQHR
jgi:hypothetical protein